MNEQVTANMNNVNIQQPAFRIEVAPVATVSTETSGGFFKMQEWQARCFDELKDSRRWIIKAPTGSGKSFEICATAADRLSRDETLKVIIAVPQTIIAAGFRANRIELPDGKRIEWCVRSDRDLCTESPRRGTGRLLSFLNDRQLPEIMSRVVLCTHATLVRAFGKKRCAFDNTLIIIDEAHHVKHREADDPDVELTNRLGALAKHALHYPELIQLGLTTATFFRGDRAPIVPDESSFTRFEFAFDEYLATCAHLRSFSYDFVLYSASYVEPLTRLFAERVGKTLVYIPPVLNLSSLATKREDVSAVLKSIAGNDLPVLEDEDKPIMRVKRGDTWVKVVNLVDENLREEKKNAIIAAHENGDASAIDVIIALQMFKEGANWRWADREVIIGQRGSLTDLVQMIGRLLRDVPSKSHVEVYQLLPFAFDQTDKSKTRESLNAYLTALLLSMLLENVIDPVVVPSSRTTGGRSERGPFINYLREAFSDQIEAIAVLEEIKTEALNAMAKGQLQGVKELRGTFLHIVSGVLSARGISRYHDEVAEQVLKMFERRTVALADLNVGCVDIELIKENPLGCLLQYVSDSCGIKTFQHLREASRSYTFLPFDEARTFAHSLNLKSIEEWKMYCASGEKPGDIPGYPNTVYEGEGWAGYGDWLGTERVATFNRIYRSFPEARAFTQTLELKSQSEWTAYCSSGGKPGDIPSNPDRSYEGEGWAGYGDWLGTGRVANKKRKFRPFAQAREHTHAQRISSQEEWRAYCKSGAKPYDIPVSPHVVYKVDGWIGYGDWFGSTSERFQPFPEARSFVHTLGIRTIEEWRRYCKSGNKPRDIPSAPSLAYKDSGWISTADWLGKRGFRPFPEAREFARGLQLRSQAEWQEYCRSGNKPDDIPAAPGPVYKDCGWISMGDWLGTGRVATRKRAFRSFGEAREYARSLRLKGRGAWVNYSRSGRRPADIPSDPSLAYKDLGWAGFEDFLGTDGPASRQCCIT